MFFKSFHKLKSVCNFLCHCIYNAILVVIDSCHMKNLTIIGVFVLMSMLCAPSVRAEGKYGQLVDKVVAHVNDDAILYSEIVKKKQELKQKKSKLPFEEKALKSDKDLLEILINDLLMSQAIKEKGLEATASEAEQFYKENLERVGMTEEQFAEALKKEGHSLKEYKARLKNEISMRRLLGPEMAKIRVSDQDVVNFYKTNPELLKQNTRFQVKQIFFQAPEEDSKKLALANDVQKKASEGEDFEGLAKKYSEGASDLGVLEKGQMIPEFEKQIEKMKIGSVSPVFKTTLGYHIIKVALPDEALAAIRERLFQEQVLSAQQSFIRERREKSFIKTLL